MTIRSNINPQASTSVSSVQRSLATEAKLQLGVQYKDILRKEMQMSFTVVDHLAEEIFNKITKSNEIKQGM